LRGFSLVFLVPRLCLGTPIWRLCLPLWNFLSDLPPARSINFDYFAYNIINFPALKAPVACFARRTPARFFCRRKGRIDGFCLMSCGFNCRCLLIQGVVGWKRVWVGMRNVCFVGGCGEGFCCGWGCRWGCRWGGCWISSWATKGVCAQGWSSELDGWSSELERWSSELDGWSSELDGWSSELDGWSSELDGWSSELDGWSSELERWSSELDGWSKGAERWSSELERWSSELERWSKGAEC
jgi:hypothetical protein